MNLTPEQFAAQHAESQIDALIREMTWADDVYPEFTRALEQIDDPKGVSPREAALYCARLLAREAYRRGIRNGARWHMQLIGDPISDQ